MDVLTFEKCWALNKEWKSKWRQVGLSLFNYQDDARSNKHKIQTILFLLTLTCGIVLIFLWWYTVVCEYNCLPTYHNPFGTCPLHLLITVRVWSIVLQLQVYFVSGLSKSSFWLMGSELVGVNHSQTHMCADNMALCQLLIIQGYKTYTFPVSWHPRLHDRRKNDTDLSVQGIT